MSIINPLSSINILHVMVGIPGSGKSTYCSFAFSGLPIVSLDAIRQAAFNTINVTGSDNDTVLLMAEIMVKSLFYAGHREVVIDGTHSTESMRNFWRRPTLWSRKFHVIEGDVNVSIKRITKDYLLDQSNPYFTELIRNLPEIKTRFQSIASFELDENDKVIHVNSLT
jgi:adenylate kinase